MEMGCCFVVVYVVLLSHTVFHGQWRHGGGDPRRFSKSSSGRKKEEEGETSRQGSIVVVHFSPCLPFVTIKLPALPREAFRNTHANIDGLERRVYSLARPPSHASTAWWEKREAGCALQCR